MHFTVETSRTEPVSALSYAEKRFAGKLRGATDAVYADAEKDRVYAYTGLPYYAPVMTMILSDPALFTPWTAMWHRWTASATWQRNMMRW